MKNALMFALALSLLASAPLAAQGQDIVGTWQMTTNSPEGDRTNTMIVTREGGKLKATARNDAGERAYDSVEVKGSAVTIVLTISYQGNPMIITYSGSLDKEGMKGDADFGGLATGTWSATRK